jgi:hypothetical protein
MDVVEMGDLVLAIEKTELSQCVECVHQIHLADILTVKLLLLEFRPLT